MMRALAVILAVVLLAACSSTDTVDLEPAKLVDFEARAKVKETWSKGVGAGQDERYTLLVPSVSGDHIFAADIEGNVFALDRSSGKRLWKVELEQPVSGGVGSGAGLVMVGTYTGQVIALAEADGAERWRARVSSEVLSPPQTNGDVVVVQAVDGKLFGLNVSDGSRRWLYDNTLPVLTLRGTGTPLVTGTDVFAGFATGKVLALNARDGILKWERRVSVAQGRTELERVIDVDGSPLLEGDLLYAVNFQGRLVALARANGRGIWEQPVSSYQSLATGFGNIYTVTDNGVVQAYDALSGELKWENNQLLRRGATAPQTLGRYVAVADYEGYVHFLEQASGELVARRKIDGDGIRSPMISEGGVLYVLSDGGELTALTVTELEK